MKLSTIFTTLTLLSIPCISRALPTKRRTTGVLLPRADITDLEILNFALTLEHVEVAFYQQGLSNYSQQDFLNAGYPEWTRGRYEQIFEHEKTHVEFLTAAISAAGAKAAQPCNYSYPVMDIKSFSALSHIFETVGTSAYNGAAAFIQNKAYLTVFASILGTETRQAAWIGSAVLKLNPWNSAFETPLDFNQAFTLASPFIKSCPESNPALAAKPFSPLNITLVQSGSRARVSHSTPSSETRVAPDKPLYAAFLIGTGTIFMPVNMTTNEVEVPNGLLGFVYVVLTNDGGRVAEETTVAGPTILQFPFDSHATRIGNGTTI